jgi:hypothetical protein
MSEYQYYEFRAVDRPLSRTEQGELRRLSSRARISAAGFVNHYDFGDFGGNPDRLMERHFDLFLYLANWATRRFSIRLPKSGLKPASLKRFTAANEDVVVRTAGDHLIVDVSCHELEQDFYDRGEGWLDKLAALRGDLINGDLRLFYLLWLMPVEYGQVADDAIEPLAGIGPLTPALKSFAQFFYIDRDLVEAAAEERQSPRTTGELRAAARLVAERRSQTEEKRRQAAQRKREREEAKARERRLDELAPRGAAAWGDVEALIALRNAAAYETATTLLADLRELALRQGTDDEFHHRLAELRIRHKTKRRLVERLNAVGLE